MILAIISATTSPLSSFAPENQLLINGFILSLLTPFIHAGPVSYALAASTLEEKTLQTEDPDGGFRTGCDQDRTYMGTLKNAETTSITILVLNQLQRQQTTPLPFPFWPIIPQAQFLLYIVISTAAGAIIT